MTCRWCPSRLACEEHGCKNPKPEVTDEMLVAAMRAFEPMSSVLRYREKDKWHACDMMAMRDAIKAALAVAPAHVIREKPRPRLIVQHYEGKANGGPFDGCEIDSDGPTVPDEQGGTYNYVGGAWVWIPGVGTDLHEALTRS